MFARWKLLLATLLLSVTVAAVGCGGDTDPELEDLGQWWLDASDDAANPDSVQTTDARNTEATTPDSKVEADGPPCEPACDGLECGDDDGCGKPCIVDAGCDGNPPCSEGVCDQSGVCGILPTAAECDDDNPCTIGDECAQGKCKAGADFLDCDDDNECTNDACDVDTGCYSVPNTLPCDDGDPCTDGDLCVEGECEAGDPNLCDDFNSCTDDYCEPGLGCINDPQPPGFPCDDNNTCTVGDACSGGLCTGGQVMDCEDFNPCTTDICNPTQGCLYQQKDQGAACDDLDACTLNDYCDQGVCKSGAAKDCDDFNGCTADSCGPGGVCKHAPLTGDFYCDDGEPCTDPDFCENGVCMSGPPVPGCN